MNDQTWLYQQTLDINAPEFAYLSAHRVFSSCVFPGAGYTEMMLSAALGIAGDSAIELVELTYQEPLQLVDQVIRICQVHLEKDESGEYACKVTSFIQGAPPSGATVHAVGK